MVNEHELKQTIILKTYINIKNWKFFFHFENVIRKNFFSFRIYFHISIELFHVTVCSQSYQFSSLVKKNHQEEEIHSHDWMLCWFESNAFESEFSPVILGIGSIFNYHVFWRKPVIGERRSTSTHQTPRTKSSSNRSSTKRTKIFWIGLSICFELRNSRSLLFLHFDERIRFTRKTRNWWKIQPSDQN